MIVKTKENRIHQQWIRTTRSLNFCLNLKLLKSKVLLYVPMGHFGISQKSNAHKN